MNVNKIMQGLGFIMALNVAIFSSPLMANELEEYALVRPENLPHLLHNIIQIKPELKLSAEQNAKLQALAGEMPPAMHRLFTKAKALEKDIARAVMLDGATAQTMTAKLDELQSIKRALTDKQIETLNRLRSMLLPEQYQMVLKHADWMADKAQ